MSKKSRNEKYYLRDWQEDQSEYEVGASGVLRKVEDTVARGENGCRDCPEEMKKVCFERLSGEEAPCIEGFVRV